MNTQVDYNNDAVPGETIQGYPAPSSVFVSDFLIWAMDSLYHWAYVSRPVYVDGLLCRFNVAGNGDVVAAFPTREVNAAIMVRGMELCLSPDFSVNFMVSMYIKRALEENNARWLSALCADCIVQAGLFGKIVYEPICDEE
jgi:hypothetical protein